jgi:hypothetical protein
LGHDLFRSVDTFLGGATDESKAVNLVPSEATQELCTTGMIVQNGLNAYLTDVGLTVARGLLKIYHELVKT